VVRLQFGGPEVGEVDVETSVPRLDAAERAPGCSCGLCSIGHFRNYLPGRPMTANLRRGANFRKRFSIIEGFRRFF